MLGTGLPGLGTVAAVVAAAEKVAGKKGKGSEVTEKCIDMFKGLEMKGSILHLNITSLSWVSLVVLLAKNSLAMRGEH